ncbi:MAG: 30S ribosomal protein S20 [Candidatus Saccharimonadales bacterium]
MPIIKSAAKRVRQDVKRTRINNRYRREMHDRVKAVVDATAKGDKKSAEAGLPLAQKAIDKAVKKGAIHKNTASRKKASLNKKVKEALASKKTTAKATTKKPATKKSAAKKSS